jgi:hypothetical protein
VTTSVSVALEAQDDFASLRHRIGRIVHQIVKDAPQAFRVDEQLH